MSFKSLRIFLIIVALISIFRLSFYVHEQNQLRKFVKLISMKKSVVDGDVDVILNNFIEFTKFDTTSQNVTIHLADFPFVFNWMSARDGDLSKNVFCNSIGIAFGMNDDSMIKIFLNYTYWKNLSYQEKKWVLYHELLHDCYDIEHSDSKSDIMYTSLPTHIENDPNQLIIKYKIKFENKR